MTEDTVIRVTVSLREKEVKTLERVQDNYNLDRSAALRFILNDWASDLGNIFWRDEADVKAALE